MYYPFGQPNRQVAGQPQYSQNRTDSKNPTITVTGTATVSVQPDTVILELAVITEGESLTVAQQENTMKMNEVIQALRSLGIPTEGIQTSAFHINPRYDFVEGEQIFRGYEVVNEITVTINNIEQAGNIIDIAVRNGANRVSNIRFIKAGEQSYYQQALEKALHDASQKARTIAETLNLPLNPIPIKITEQFTDAPITYKAFAATQDSLNTSIEPGQISISATVQMIFQY